MSETIETFPAKEQIEERAYEIYLERGGADGNDMADWLTAEEELKALAQRPADDGAAGARNFDLRPDTAVGEDEIARAEELLRELYERSRAIAAGAGS